MLVGGFGGAGEPSAPYGPPVALSAALEMPMPGAILSGYLTASFVPFISKPLEEKRLLMNRHPADTPRRCLR